MDLKSKVLARFRLLSFIQAMRPSDRPLSIGRHISEITKRLDRAVSDYQRGQSTYLIVTVPYRHGKTEIVSRHFPPYFLGHATDAEVILATYGQGLSNAHSRDARRVIKSDAYAEIFPDVRISSESSSVQSWGISGHNGKFQAITISAGGTGKGADLLVIDDYLRGRSVAESALIREQQWNNFAGNLMTRLAPVHIVVILATPWHVDDIIGRIKQRIDPKSDLYDEEFPHFEVMKFPARNEDGTFLFPERFSESWYRKQFAILGDYQSAALLQCEPTIRGGNMIKTGGVRIEDRMPDGLRWVRFWDLASSTKELAKQDPDSSAGARVAVRKEKGIPHLYIDDVVFCQAEAPERNRLIVSTAERDGGAVPIGVESVAGYKDTYTTMKSILQGRNIVQKVTVSVDKVVRAGEVAPVFDAGNVHMKKAWWNQAVLEQLAEFPAGKHDDIVDAITGGYAMALDHALGSRLIEA